MATDIIAGVDANLALESLVDSNGLTVFISRQAAELFRRRGLRSIMLEVLLSDDAPMAEWPTVTAAAQDHLSDVDCMTLATAKGKICRAIRQGRIATNGKHGHDRRINPDSLAAWRLTEREKDLAKEDDGTPRHRRTNTTST